MLVNTASWTSVANAKITSSAAVIALLTPLRRSGEPMPIFLLLGGSFEMYLGTTKRAPTWMQRVGLEWFFRFLMEPKRLFRRYFVTDTRFVWLLARELLAAKFPPAAKP